METFDQRFGFRISVRIEPLTRMAVAAEKALEPKHVTVAGAPHDHRSARSSLDQAHATQNQGAHDALAELSFRDQQRPQSLRRDCQRLH